MVVAVIYATLGLAGMLAAELRNRGLLDSTFGYTALVVLAAIVGSGLTRRPGRWEIWVGLGVLAVYTLAFLRLFLDAAERTHLIEYSVVAILVYQALVERRRGGRRVPVPAVLAIVGTILVGWIDEGIQAMLPNRVYDLIDVGFNAVAAVLAVSVSAALGLARRRDRA